MCAVMAAGMHRAGIEAGIGQAGLLLDRQGVHVGTDASDLPSGAQHATTPVPASPSDFIARPGEMLRDECAATLSAKAELRVAMKIVA